MQPPTFHSLYEAYANDIFRFARFLTRSDDAAADIASETFPRVGRPRHDSRHDGAGVQLVADFCPTLSGGSETNREPANREPRLLYRLHGNLTVGAFT